VPHLIAIALQRVRQLLGVDRATPCRGPVEQQAQDRDPRPMSRFGFDRQIRIALSESRQILSSRGELGMQLQTPLQTLLRCDYPTLSRVEHSQVAQDSGPLLWCV